MNLHCGWFATIASISLTRWTPGTESGNPRKATRFIATSAALSNCMWSFDIPPDEAELDPASNFRPRSVKDSRSDFTTWIGHSQSSTGDDIASRDIEVIKLHLYQESWSHSAILLVSAALCKSTKIYHGFLWCMATLIQNVYILFMKHINPHKTSWHH